MSVLIRPTDWCICESGKLYRDCCSRLTKLPKNPSKQLLRRYWSKHINAVICSLLSSLEFDDVLEVMRCEADERIGRLSFAAIEDDMVLRTVDAFGLFHMPADSLYDDEIIASELDEDDDEDPPFIPVGVEVASLEGLFTTSPQREVFVALLVSPFSWFKVTKNSPDGSVVLQDLILDAEVEVLDHTLSRSSAEGMVVCAKAIRLKGATLLAGVFPKMLPPSTVPRLLNIVQDLRQFTKAQLKSDLTPAVLFLLAEQVIGHFGEICAQVYPPNQPRMHNTDGDPMEYRQLEYSYSNGSVGEVAGRINSVLDSIVDGPEPAVEERDTAGQPTKIVISNVRTALNSSMLDTILFARIIVESGSVTVEVNSVNRAERVKKELRKLGDLLSFVKQTEIAVDPMNPPPGAAPIDPKDMPPEILEALQEKMREYQEKWLTQPVPALQGMTPLEASKSPEMLPVLEALLDDFAVKEDRAKVSGSKLTTFDVEELRTRLGLNKNLV